MSLHDQPLPGLSAPTQATGRPTVRVRHRHERTVWIELTESEVRTLADGLECVIKSEPHEFPPTESQESALDKLREAQQGLAEGLAEATPTPSNDPMGRE